jgi:hypothetical protein
MASFWQLTSVARSSTIRPSNGELGQRLHHLSTEFSTDSSTIWWSLARWSCPSYYYTRCRCLFDRGGTGARLFEKRRSTCRTAKNAPDLERREVERPNSTRVVSRHSTMRITGYREAPVLHSHIRANRGETTECTAEPDGCRQDQCPEECFGTCASVHARESGKATLVTTSSGSTTQESEHDAHALKSMWQRAREPMIVTVQTSPCEDRIVSCTRRRKQRTRSLRAA